MGERLVVAERWAAERQHGVLSGRQASRLGLPDPWPRRLVARGRWRRLHRGVFWTVPTAVPSLLAVLTGARLFAGGGECGPGVVSGMSSARLWGLQTDDAPWVPELTLPAALRRAQPPNLRYRWLPLRPEDLAVCAGLPCTTPRHVLRQLAPRQTFAEQLVLADAVLRLRLAGAPELRTWAADCHAGRRALFAADGRAESVFESRVRAELLEAAVPVPVLQHVVRHEGRFVARVDLAWPDQRLIVEADGAQTHAHAAALRDDLRRQNRLVADGWTVLRFTWADLGRIGAIVAAALRSPAAT